MTELARRVARNTGAILMANALSRAVGLLAVILVARYLREEGFGLFSFVFAYIEFFAIFTDLGINAILIREIAKDRSTADRLLGAALSLKLCLSLAAMLLSWAVISFLLYPPTTKLLAYLASLALFTSFRLPSFRSLFDVIFQVELTMKYPAFLGFLTEVLAASAVLLVIVLHGGLPALVLAQVLAGLPGFFLLVHRFRRSVPIAWTLDIGLWRRMLGESLPLALTGIFVLVYSRVDVLILSLMKGDAAVGYYAAAYRLTGTLGLIPSALMASLYPLMSQYRETSPEAFRKAFHQGFEILVLIAAPLAAIFSVLSEPILRLIYGQAFAFSAPALVLLGWTAALNFFSYLIMTAFNAMNKQGVNARLTFSMIPFNIAANFLLIPRYSFVGASMATLLTEGILVAVGFSMIARHMGRISLERTFLYCLSAGLAGVIFYAIQIHPILQLLLGISAYGVFVLMLRGLTREELAAIKAVFAKQGSVKGERFR